MLAQVEFKAVVCLVAGADGDEGASKGEGGEGRLEEGDVAGGYCVARALARLCERWGKYLGGRTINDNCGS